MRKQTEGRERGRNDEGEEIFTVFFWPECVTYAHFYENNEKRIDLRKKKKKEQRSDTGKSEKKSPRENLNKQEKNKKITNARKFISST